MKNHLKDAMSVLSFLLSMVYSISVKLKSMEEKVRLIVIVLRVCDVM